MVTIRRHSIPADSYDPNRPLNDLLVAQFEQFKHIAEKLPAEVRSEIPATPSPDDRTAVDQFIAAITRFHANRKQEKPRLVKKMPRRQAGSLAIAAAAEKRPKRARSKAKAKSGSDAGTKQ